LGNGWVELGFHLTLRKQLVIFQIYNTGEGWEKLLAFSKVVIISQGEIVSDCNIDYQGTPFWLFSRTLLIGLWITWFNWLGGCLTFWAPRD